MSARTILAVLSLGFFVASAVRMAAGYPVSHPQVRTWLTVGGIFAIVSIWLFFASS